MVNKEREDLARDLLQQTADEDPPQLTAEAQAWAEKEVVRILQEKVAEYERLQAALGRLQSLKDSNCIVPLENRFAVAIGDVDYDAMTVAAGYGATLVEACEAALKAYDALSENKQ